MPHEYNYNGKDAIFGGMGMSEPLEKPIKRRDFLGIAAFGAFLAAFGAACIGSLRLLLPKVFSEPSRRYKIGEPERFSMGEITIPPGRSVYVLRDTDGFYAISAVCTHLGCIVKLHSGVFECPCHGSRFTLNGDVISGAAPKALEWYAISMAPDGQLIVDEGIKVKSGTFFKV